MNIFRNKGLLLAFILLAPAALSLACGTTEPTPPPNATEPAQPTRAAEGPTSPPPATSGCEGGLRIHSVTDRVEDGFVLIQGLVDNCTDRWVDIKINITLYDANGNPLNATSTTGEGEQVAFVSNRPVAPGATGAFQYIRDTAYIEGEYDHSELSAEWIEANTGYAARVTSPDFDIDEGDLFVTVSGVFESVGTVPCPSPVIVAVGYDEDGNVYSVAEVALTDMSGNDIEELAPGDSVPFEGVLLENYTGEVQNVEVMAGCYLYGRP